MTCAHRFRARRGTLPPDGPRRSLGRADDARCAWSRCIGRAGNRSVAINFRARLSETCSFWSSWWSVLTARVSRRSGVL